MKKKFIFSLISRGALGFPLGITIGYVLSILFSLRFANGYYSPCVPDLISMTGNEINAVILQTFLSGLLGTGFAASSVIWEIDHWNIVKQTGIYFLIVSVIMMPVSYFLYWMEHSIIGFVQYFGIFVFIFVVIWIIQYIIARQIVRKMNRSLDSARKR